MIVFIYNILLPVGFIFFLPGLIIKLIKREGYKKSYLERFAIFTKEKTAELNSVSAKSPIWIHSVSVGETQLAVDLVNYWKSRTPELEFVVSTTTTTGQTLAINKLSDKAHIIFCPIDFGWAVKKVIRLINPGMLVIFETEIWPNLITIPRKKGIPVVQVNARISDHSFKGYKRFRYFIRPFLKKLNLSCAQTQVDAERLKVICPELNVVKTGTMKFDQKIPKIIPEIDLKGTFEPGVRILLAASTHNGEEEFIAGLFKEIKKDYQDLRLIIIPRHSERGVEVAEILKKSGISYLRRSENKKPSGFVECLLADTTGEMLSFMNQSNIVIVGKSFVGNDEGQNIIEPAILGKPIICGKVLRNFKYVLRIMKDKNAVLSIADDELKSAIIGLLVDPKKCQELGQNARNIVDEQRGARERTVVELEKILKS